MKYTIKRKREGKIKYSLKDDLFHTVMLYDDDDNFLGTVSLSDGNEVVVRSHGPLKVSVKHGDRKWVEFGVGEK